MTGKCHNRGRNNGVVGHPHAVMSTAERFEMKVDRSGECHRWTAAHDSKGYGNFYFEGRTRSVHIVALLLAGIDVPDDMTVDHVWERGCQFRDCVRVDHLEVVPLRTNILRGNSMGARCARKTHCKRGHEFTSENTWITARGYRLCRSCRYIRDHQRHAGAVDLTERDDHANVRGG